MSRVLFVFTSATTLLGTGGQTGWFLPEAAHPYYVLSPYFAIDFAAPDGPNPPLNPSSIEFSKGDDESQRFLNDSAVKSLLANTKPLSAICADDYVALLYVGGHGPVIDLATDKKNIQMANAFYRSGKIIAAICHCPAALVGVTGADGTSIFKDKVVTGFSNVEEEQVDKVEAVSFLLEDRVKSLGATYEKADEPWGPKVVHSGNLITGQNPASARPLGEELLKTLQVQA